MRSASFLSPPLAPSGPRSGLSRAALLQCSSSRTPADTTADVDKPNQTSALSQAGFLSVLPHLGPVLTGQKSFLQVFHALSEAHPEFCARPFPFSDLALPPVRHGLLSHAPPAPEQPARTPEPLQSAGTGACVTAATRLDRRHPQHPPPATAGPRRRLLLRPALRAGRTAGAGPLPLRLFGDS